MHRLRWNLKINRYGVRAGIVLTWTTHKYKASKFNKEDAESWLEQLDNPDVTMEKV